MRNRPVLDLIVAYGGLLDSRLSSVRPEFVDSFTNVGNAEVAPRGREVAYAVAHVDPSPQAFGTFLPLLSELPQLFDV